MSSRSLVICIMTVLIVLMGLYRWVLSTTVGVFSDGSVHVHIADYIRTYATIPPDDFAGQINSNFRQPRSFTIPMIYPQNIYIFFASLGLITWLETTVLFDLIGFIALIIWGIFFFHITVCLTNSRKIATTACGLFLLLPLWYWILVRRIVEPFSMLFAFTALYVLIQWMWQEWVKQRVILWFFLFIIFYTKQSNIYFLILVGIFGLLYTRKVKDYRYVACSFFVLWFPAFWYSFSLLWTISPVPPWIPYVDTVLLTPRWKKQAVQERESKINVSVSNDVIKKITYNQFVENIQISPRQHIEANSYVKVVQNFLPLQISSQWTQGYHLPFSKRIGRFNLLLLCFGLLFLVVHYRSQKKYIHFAVLSFLIVLLFSLKFTVFRYYINSVVLFLLLFSYGIYAVWLYGRKVNSFLLYSILVIFSVLTLTQEFKKNIAYQHSIGHRLTNGSWWIAELVALAKQPTLFAGSGDIFTPILEAAYYLDKKIYWDEKFFFIQNKADLIAGLQQAGVRYVLNPFYSTQVKRKNRKYYDGIPVDSTMGQLLLREDCFTRLHDAEAFDFYILDESCE